MINVINSWETVLLSSLTSGATSMTISSGDATELGSIAAGDYYIATLRDSGDTQKEIIHITAIAGAVLTIERGKETTNPAAFSASDVMRIELTAGLLEEFIQGVLPDGDGDIVVTDAEQTLTNKTLINAKFNPSVEELLEDNFLL